MVEIPETRSHPALGVVAAHALAHELLDAERDVRLDLLAKLGVDLRVGRRWKSEQSAKHVSSRLVVRRA